MELCLAYWKSCHKTQTQRDKTYQEKKEYKANKNRNNKEENSWVIKNKFFHMPKKKKKTSSSSLINDAENSNSNLYSHLRLPSESTIYSSSLLIFVFVFPQDIKTALKTCELGFPHLGLHNNRFFFFKNVNIFV